jgi:restriction system-associated AAA family ATPase
MKLLCLTLHNEFRSFKPFPRREFYNPPNRENVDAICLVGLNGSGKSQLIELVAEIFYLLDVIFLYEGKTNQIHIPKFDIEYLIYLNNKNQRIKISNAHSDKRPDFFLIDEDSHETKILDFETQRKYLPAKVIGYTSGLNETLSIPFSDIMQMYSDKVSRQGLKQTTPVASPRLLHVDYETNSLILISNYLLNSKSKLSQFSENIRIQKLESFRLIIQLKHKAAKKIKGIKITEEQRIFLKAFENCASSSKYEKETDSYFFDFIVNDATKEAFIENGFDSPQTLFMAFYKFYLLNPLTIGKDYRRYLSSQRKRKILTKPPFIMPENKVFRFEEIKLRISQPNRIIDYIGISDGEHQYINIFGSVMLFDQANVLYLFDESETHFNPQWRSKFIQILNSVVTNKYQDFIISTHSPFIISDCHGYNVFKFNRDKNGVVSFLPIGFETYAASFEYILEEGFGVFSVPEFSREKINKLKESKDIIYLESELKNFGDSIEKFYLIQHIEELKEHKDREE